MVLDATSLGTDVVVIVVGGGAVVIVSPRICHLGFLPSTAIENCVSLGRLIRSWIASILSEQFRARA